MEGEGRWWGGRGWCGNMLGENVESDGGMVERRRVIRGRDEEEGE